MRRCGCSSGDWVRTVSAPAIRERGLSFPAARIGDWLKLAEDYLADRPERIIRAEVCLRSAINVIE